MTQQQQVTRTIWLTVAMMTASVLMPIASIASFVVHAVGMGEVFLVAMMAFGAAGFNG